MANKHEKCSTLLVAKEMQIKIIFNQGSDDTNCWQGCGEMNTHSVD